MKTKSEFGLRREAKRHAALGKHNRLRKAVSPLSTLRSTATPVLRSSTATEDGEDGRSSLRCTSPRQAATALQNMASLLLCVFALMPLGMRAATNDLTSALQKGLFEEEANRNLDAAIANYQSLAAQFDEDRPVAATAIFRLGECYRKLGRTNDAVVQYQRILREFSDQTTLTTLSRQNLTGLGSQPTTTAAPAVSMAARQEQKRLLEEEIKLAEVQQKTVKNMFDVGKATSDDLVAKEREILQLRRQLAALDTGADESLGGAGIQTPAVVIDDEETEIRRLKAMIQNSPDLINAPAFDGKSTPLNLAALKGQLRVAAFLLANGADINFKANNDRAPLFYAAANGHRAMVELLLAKGADVNTRDFSGKTPLHLAADNGFQSVAEALLVGKADVNARDTYQYTPLHYAARKGHVAMVAFLLDHRANPDTQGKDGRTPLSITALAGYAETLKKLLTAGAKPDLADSDGRTPLSYAAENGHFESVKALLAAKADPNADRWILPLHLAIHRKDPMMMKSLLDARADASRVSAIDWPLRIGNRTIYPGGKTRAEVPPLFLAVAEGSADAVKLLLQYKTDPNGTDPSGFPVILSAMDQLDILKALLEAGANPNVDDGEGRYPLLAARDPETVRLLLAHRANPEGMGKGTTPLLQAATGQSGNQGTEIAEVLLQGGANVNATTEQGWTALHFAAAMGNQKLVELLLAHKADVNARNKEGITPLGVVKETPASPSPGGLKPISPPPAQRAGASAPSAQTTPTQPVSLAVLLRQHGALDDLPDFNSITACRPSTNFTYMVFRKGTNNWNRFTLLELIGKVYGFVSTDYNPASDVVSLDQWKWNQKDLRFPDFHLVTIQRAVPGASQRKTINVDLESLLRSGECSDDVTLQWGDRVEIPEADHPVDQQWAGLDANQIITLAKCVSRNVTLIIKGTTNSIAVGPYFRPARSDVEKPLVPGVEFFRQKNGSILYNSSRGQMQQAAGCFMLTAALRGSGLLRASSDLTRVKVTRRDPKTGKKLEWVLDCSGNNAPDLWLRDGDVIEVPEKP
jgi:ankyrin repeat protein